MIICIVSIETGVIKVPDILSFIIAFITDKLYHKFILVSTVIIFSSFTSSFA